MEFIGIADVLRRTNIAHEHGTHVAFAISFIKKDGKIKRIKNAGRWVKDPLLKHKNTSLPPRKAKVNYNKSDTILIYDHDGQGDNYRTVKIPTIIEFEGYKVKH